MQLGHRAMTIVGLACAGVVAAAAPVAAQVLPAGQEELVQRVLSIEGCTLERAEITATEARGELACGATHALVRLVHPSAAPAERAVQGVVVRVDPPEPAVRSAVEARLREDRAALRWVMPPAPREAPPPLARKPSIRPKHASRATADPAHRIAGAILLAGWITLAFAFRATPDRAQRSIAP